LDTEIDNRLVLLLALVVAYVLVRDTTTLFVSTCPVETVETIGHAEQHELQLVLAFVINQVSTTRNIIAGTHLNIMKRFSSFFISLS
jgi:hypothetical protein